MIRLDADLRAALVAIQVRDGVPITEQIRRGIRLWLDAKRRETRTAR